MADAVVIAPGYADHSIEAAMLAPFGVGLTVLDWHNDRARLIAGLADAPIIFVRDTAMDTEVIRACASARGIIRYGVGIDRLDLDRARSQGIKVANIPDYGADIEVADHTMALYLAVQRRIASHDHAVRSGAWGMGQSAPIYRIAGKTLGLVGFGRIARAVKTRFAAFGVTDVLVHDPYLAAGQAEAAGVRAVDLDTLARNADIVSIHAPVADPAKPMIDAGFLGAMRQDAILINTARGAHIDEAALAEALTRGPLFGAGLDVFRTEPPARDNALLGLPNVVLSDHAGWYSEATIASLQRQAGEAAVAILGGSAPAHWVNP
ncbi:C-terminal binding protein [Devosia sediminis]|uniref:C-terminal binding protein n=1 Tax=Devosia sediminis TaxID=2798801 RepID=A0A934MKP6_9HYPH|nr:C-terminal binding protein [Devosia sediminis]MBJ3785373.1 C-terminal binding protein [Devosia sediminis]